ncbi:MAG TPA: nitrate- and nitrite sensing domain-containing protein [Pilimelia sp.]|nr:nitrate- and nitrite sensing domain-containing protein [Pilimelia sp.]
MAAQDQMDAPVAISRHRRAPADGSTGRPADRGPVDRRQPGSHPSDRRRPGERRPAGRRPAPQVRLPEPRRRSVLRIRDWRVRTKLAVVLVVPSLALLMVAGVQIRTLVDEATRLGDFAAQVELTDRVSALVHEVQAERDRTVGELAEFEAGERPGDPGQLSAQLRSQRAAVDRAAAAVRARGGDVAGDTAWRAAYGRAVARLDGLRSVRDGVADGRLPRRAAHDVYGRTVDALLALMAAPAPGAGNADLDRLRAGYVELSRTKEVGSQLRASIFAVAAAQGFAPGDYIEIADLRAQQLAAVVRFRSVASASQIDQYDQVLAGRALELTGQLEQAVIDSAGRSDFRLDAPNWWAASTAQHDLVRKAEAALLADAATRAAQRSADQWSRTWLVVGGIAGALLIALIISIAIGRSMARSLRVLRREALTVAQVELPQVLDQLSDIRRRTPDIEVRPPSVRSADEIGEVADAFTAVHSSAVSLAIEQAAMRRNVNTMFINLARRSQVLVERQLELLDDLEREEQDPDLLENLFKLDHLAARMRRNDESLLVLAGNDNARRWSAPVAPSAAVLAAIAEIEQYTRVRHTADDSLFVVGHAVADLVHLLAELLENATIFSPPGTTVEVVGRVQGGRVLIEIADEGMGMSERALEEANALLAEPPAADVAASERMGLFVVSHLAARHGVSVHLRPAAQGLVA